MYIALLLSSLAYVNVCIELLVPYNCVQDTVLAVKQSFTIILSFLHGLYVFYNISSIHYTMHLEKLNN